MSTAITIPPLRIPPPMRPRPGTGIVVVPARKPRSRPRKPKKAVASPLAVERFSAHIRLGRGFDDVPRRCSIWTGPTWADGCGRFRPEPGDYAWRVTRWIWECENGQPVPAGHYIIPVVCGDIRCCEPTHLRALARSEARRWMRRRTHAKLTAAKVASIRVLAADGVPQAKIAKLYQTGQSNVNAIVNRKTWASVD